MGRTNQRGWSDAHTDALRKYHTAGISFSNSAAQINAEFGTSYSRNAAIGRATRIGLVSTKEKGPAPEPRRRELRERKPRARIIQANGNSNRLRIIESVESEPIALRCAAVVPLNISLDELNAATCRYPYGDTPPLLFCGHVTLDGATYCDLHHELCHKPAHPTRGQERPDAGSLLRHSILPSVLALAAVGDWEAA